MRPYLLFVDARSYSQELASKRTDFWKSNVDLNQGNQGKLNKWNTIKVLPAMLFALALDPFLEHLRMHLPADC